MGKESGSATHQSSGSSGPSGPKKKSKAKMFYQKQSRGHSRGGYRGGRGGRPGGSNDSRGRQSKFLTVGMKGFLCTTNFREKDAVKEAYNLLNEYCDERDEIPANVDVEVSSTGVTSPTSDSTTGTGTGPPSSPPKDSVESSESGTPRNDMDCDSTQPPVPSQALGNVVGEKPKRDEDDDDDFESALKSEISMLKSDQVRYKFQCVDTGVRNVVFISTTVNPITLAHRILDDITSTKQQKSQALLRMIPIETICRADCTDIKKTALSWFPKYFKTGFNSFQVIYKCRYNNSMDRNEVIRVVAEAVMEINSFNTVNLNDPKYVVIVEIIKGLCCLSVVTDYNKFRKYNLIEVSAAPAPPTSKDKEAAASTLKQEEDISKEAPLPIDADTDAVPTSTSNPETDPDPKSDTEGEKPA